MPAWMNNPAGATPIRAPFMVWTPHIAWTMILVHAAAECSPPIDKRVAPDGRPVFFENFTYPYS
jgi:hypothetical protein